jgi:hypothetical protein
MSEYPSDNVVRSLDDFTSGSRKELWLWGEPSLIYDFEFSALVLCRTEEILFIRGATLYCCSGIGGFLSSP